MKKINKLYVKKKKRKKKPIFFDYSKNFKSAYIGKFNPINVVEEMNLFIVLEGKYNP